MAMAETAATSNGAGSAETSGAAASQAPAPSMAQLRLVQDVTQESFAAGTVAMQRKVLESGHSHDVMRHLVNWRVRRYYQAWCEVRPQQPCLIEMCENACGVSRAKKSVAIPGVAPRPGVRSQRHGAWRRAAACRAATCPGNTTLRSSLRHRCCGQATPFKKDLRKMGVVTARRKALIERLGQPAEPHGNAPGCLSRTHPLRCCAFPERECMPQNEAGRPFCLAHSDPRYSMSATD